MKLRLPPIRYTRLRTRLIVSFILLAIISVGVVTTALYLNTRAQLRQSLRGRLRDAVAIGALQVDGDIHATLTDPSQEGNETYMRIKKVLQNIRDQGTDITFVYSMRQDPSGDILFIVDAEESEEDISHLGDIYDDAGPVLKENFATMNTPMVENSFYTDYWGTWITGYAPFYAQDGRREGIIGMDISATNVVQAERRALWISLAIFGAVTPLLAVMGWFLGNRIAMPIMALTGTAVEITQGNLEARSNVQTEDEIGTLSQTFNTMAARLNDLINTLEQRVADRTHALEHRAVQLRTAAEVGSAAASMRNLDQLLTQTAKLISERFGYYHVGIFLLDERAEFAVLRASNSSGGQRMLERKHQLKVKEVGIVGYVTGSGEARIALDVGKDAVFFDNPDLPETRSEMALPLIAGGKILGALDIQSTVEAAFTAEDIATLQILADQLAVAIQNANLFADNQSALEATRRAYGELTHQAWSNLLQTQPGIGYLCPSGGDTEFISGKWDDILEKAIRSGHVSSNGESSEIGVPIKVRGQAIGAIRLCKQPEAGPWTKEETQLAEALADQLSTALEGARLYADAQRRAERERTVSQITTKIRSTSDPRLMLQTAIEELKQALGTNNVQIKSFKLAEKENQNGKQEPDKSQANQPSE